MSRSPSTCPRRPWSTRSRAVPFAAVVATVAVLATIAVVAAAAVVGSAAVVVAAAPSDTAQRGGCLVPPVDAPVTDPFRMPACRYCAGNRGIEYGPTSGSPVVAVAAGTVDFAGSVAGTRWLVVRHADDRRASYGHLASLAVRAGDTVRAGQRLGTTTDRFYLGLRDGDDPVDPTPLLGRLRHRARLVPADGSPARPAGPPRLICPIATRAR